MYSEYVYEGRNHHHDEERHVNDVPERKQSFVGAELSHLSSLIQMFPQEILCRLRQADSMLRDYW
jgi:hypothetical protein